jgi:hypothetical protein
MKIQAAGAVFAVLFFTGCATTTPAPRFSAVSPADVDAPEAATPPAAPALASEAEPKRPEATADTSKPAVGHEGHSMPAASGPADEVYTCPMHPEVRQSTPGSCTKCGMDLVKRAGARPQP